MKREMERIVADLPEGGAGERPEVAWLKEQYGRFLEREAAVSRRAGDRCLYQRIYGRPPEKESDILKIRYWRTGRHLPADYGTCFAFGQALGLGEEEMRFLMQGYYDCCDRVFYAAQEEARSVYRERRAVMERLTGRYLGRISPKRMEQMNIAQDDLCHNIRHLYYTDALCCVHRGLSERRYGLERHISSINYDSELNRNLKLLGVIPRKTMIRHLFLLGMPDLSVEFLDEMLGALGYLPLCEEHTLRTGECLDLLLLRLLRWYGQTAGESTAKRVLCLQEALRALDELLDEYRLHRYRFMLFKALEAL